MIHKSTFFLILSLCAGMIAGQSIERKKLRVPFSHRGIAKIRRYEVQHPDIPAAFDGFRIAFVTDTHYKSKFKERELALLIRMLRSLQPDLLLLGGDYQEGCEYVVELFDSIAAVRPPYGIAGVMGNNDYERCHDEIVSAMKSHGMYPLEHEIMTIRKDSSQIFVAGVRDPFDLRANGDSPAQQLDSADYVILLTHTPDYTEATDNSRADLSLAGHTHGGQVTYFGLYAPYLRSSYGQRFRTGLKKSSQGVPILISNGLGTSNRNARFFAPSDIIILDLYSQPSNE